MGRGRLCAGRKISIHAPRAGCDVNIYGTLNNPSSYFYPRTPGGVRPLLSQRRGHALDISIHAPRAGCDMYDCSKTVIQQGYFYPRTPGGVRLVVSEYGSLRSLFLSTHPGRGATRPSGQCRRGGIYFYPRTPGGVRQYRALKISPFVSYFYPRTPAGCDETR